MQFNLADALVILGRTPGVVRAMLDGLDDRWTRANYGENTFSPFDVVGHLIFGDLTDWVMRTRHILEHGSERPFVPFDRYAQYERDRGKSMAELLDEFAATRAAKLEELQSLGLTEADFDRRGEHPELGPVTLRQLLATWVVHDLHHIGQIAKALARQYTDEVGAWRAYIGILGNPPA
jgi:hypothetical protein